MAQVVKRAPYKMTLARHKIKEGLFSQASRRYLC